MADMRPHGNKKIDIIFSVLEFQMVKFRDSHVFQDAHEPWQQVGFKGKFFGGSQIGLQFATSIGCMYINIPWVRFLTMFALRE